MRQRIDRPRQSSHRRGPAQLTVSLPVVVLLLFCSLCGIPGGQTRLLPVDFWCRGYGDQTRELCPRGGSRSLLQTTVSRPSPPPTSAPNVSPSSLQRSPAPTPARTPAPAPAPSSVHHQAPSPTPGTSPQASPSKKKSTGTPVIVAAVTIGAVSLLLVVGAIFIAFRTRTILRKRSRERGFPWKQGISDSENEELSRQTFRGVPPISWGEIEAACEEFTNVIGDSADCIIFKGTRPSDGTQIAVTRMRIPPGSWTPSKEIGFRHKVNDLARMQHDNLLNLLAYCSSEQPFDRMLVFEYAPNGTVHEQLHGDDSTAEHLDWAMRMKIVMGAAYGLHYMHHELSPPRSHFRFDASHVFITDDYTAKVADFGITSSPTAARKSLGRRSSFNRFVRTITHTDFDNYRESSYRETPYFVESNIRGFGTFLLEVITGRRPYTETQGPLIDWASDYLQDPAKYDRLKDPSLKSYKESELAGLCEIVQLCVQQKPGKLPEMKEVVDMMAKALNMTQDKANRKASPLLWAEAQLLTSMDRSEDGGTPTSNASAGPSPRQWGPHSPGMPNNLWGDAGSGGPSPSPASGGGRHQLSGDHEISFPSTPNLSSSAAISREPNRGSSRLWSSNQGELQPPSPGFILGGEEQEVPLTGGTSSHRNSIDRFQPPPHDRDPRRSFRRAWAETATELSRLDGLSETSRSRPNRPFDTLSR